MKNAGTIAVFLGIVIIGGIVAYGTGVFDKTNTANFGQQLQPSTDNDEPITGIQTYKGNLNLSTKTYDTLDSANTGLGDDTEIDTVCYEKIGNSVDDWIELDIISEAETGDGNIDVDGILEMWCEVHPEDNQEYYIDASKIVKNNKEIDTWIWDDADDDGEDTYIFRVSLADITPSTDGEAVMTLNWYVYDEETSDALADTVADFAGVATGETTTVLPVNIDLDTSSTGGDAKYLKEIRIRFNETDDTKYVPSLTTITLPDGSTMSLTEFSEGDAIVGSNTEWKHRFVVANDYNEAYLLAIEKDTTTEVDFPVNLRTSFSGSTEGICIEVGFRYINGENVASSWDADDITVSANTTVASTCSIS